MLNLAWVLAARLRLHDAARLLEGRRHWAWRFTLSPFARLCGAQAQVHAAFSTISRSFSCFLGGDRAILDVHPNSGFSGAVFAA